MRNATVQLGGVPWEIRFVNRRELASRKHMGQCDRDKREILIYKRLGMQDLLDTLLHEMRHAQHPVLFEAEEWINDTSTELAIAILKTGVVQSGKEESG